MVRFYDIATQPSRTPSAPVDGAIVFNLPIPPSTNNLFSSSRRGYRFKSRRYNAWLTEAGWILKVQRSRLIVGPVQVVIRATPKRRRRDADNLIKPLLDLLVSARVIEGDDWRTVRSVTAAWVDGIEPGLVRVEVRAA